ncbi:MAG: type IV pilus modification protein PilV [Sulfuricella sp.]
MNRSVFQGPRSFLASRHQRGTTMLEVLITIVVIAFGLLGLAGLQAVSMKNNNHAYYRSVATMMAHDVTERMRANRTAALGGSYATAIGVAAPTPADVASTDLSEWKKNIAASLPSGDAANSVNGTVATITIQWVEGSNTTTFVTQTDL